MRSELLLILGRHIKPKLSVYLFASALLTATGSAQLKPTRMTGTWRLTGVETTGPNARTVSSPQPGLLIFTGDHYSNMWVTSDQPRTALKDSAKATVAELLATWGSFNAASGTYEILGGNLILRPAVAKNPQVMAPGADQTFSFKLAGNTLTISNVRNARGPVVNPTTRTYLRIE